MQITVTFDSLEEFQKYIQTAQAPAGQPEAPKPVEKPKKAEKPAEKPQEPAVEAPTPAVEAPTPAVEAPAGKADPGIDMVMARKILADLNKEAGANVARETLKKLGYASLKAVPEDKLQEVVDAARKEAGNA